MNHTQKILSVSTMMTGLMLSSSLLTMVQALNYKEVETGAGYAENMGTLISSVLSIVMVIALILVLIYLIWGGIGWITAGGDKGKTEEARNKITAAVIGIIILAAAWALVNFVAYVLGFTGGFNDIFKDKNIVRIGK